MKQQKIRLYVLISLVAIVGYTHVLIPRIGWKLEERVAREGVLKKFPRKSGEINAFIHAYFSAEYGSNTLYRFMVIPVDYFHELITYLDYPLSLKFLYETWDNHRKDTARDLFNNHVGLQIAAYAEAHHIDDVIPLVVDAVEHNVTINDFKSPRVDHETPIYHGPSQEWLDKNPQFLPKNAEELIQK